MASPFLGPACASNFPVCFFGNAVVVGTVAIYGKLKSRRESRDAVKELATDGLVNEEFTTSRELTVVPKATGLHASPPHRDSLPNWAVFFSKAGVAHLRIYMGGRGERVWDFEGVGRAVVPFVGGDRVRGVEVDFRPSAGGYLPGRASVTGTPGSSVVLVVVPFEVDMCPAVGDGSWDVEQVGSAMVLWNDGGSKLGGPGGMCLPGKAGFSGAPSDSTAVSSSTLETCPAAVAENSMLDDKQIGPALVRGRKGDGEWGDEEDLRSGGFGYLPGEAGVAGAPIVPFTLEAGPPIGNATLGVEQVGSALERGGEGDGAWGDEEDFRPGGVGCLPGKAGVAGAPTVPFTLEVAPPIGSATLGLEQVGPATEFIAGDVQGVLPAATHDTGQELPALPVPPLMEAASTRSTREQDTCQAVVPWLGWVDAPQREAVAAPPMAGVAPIVELRARTTATPQDTFQAVVPWLGWVDAPQREAVAAPPMAGVAPIVELRARTTVTPAVKPTEAGALVVGDFSCHPPHGHDEPGCVSAAPADGVIGVCALYLVRLLCRGGGRRLRKNQRRCRTGDGQKSGGGRKKTVNDVTTQAAAAFVDCVRRAGGGRGWDNGTTPPIIDVFLGGRASKREMIQGVVVLLTSILTSPGGKERLRKVVQCARQQALRLGPGVAYIGVAMGLLPPTMVGGTEGPTFSNMVALARAPSSLWFSAPDMTIQGILVLLDDLVALPGGGELVRRVMMRAKQGSLGLDPRVEISRAAMGLLLPVMAGGTVALPRMPPCLRLPAPAMPARQLIAVALEVCWVRGGGELLREALEDTRREGISLNHGVSYAAAAMGLLPPTMEDGTGGPTSPYVSTLALAPPPLRFSPPPAMTMQTMLVLLGYLVCLPGRSELVRRVLMRARQEVPGLAPRRTSRRRGGGVRRPFRRISGRSDGSAVGGVGKFLDTAAPDILRGGSVGSTRRIADGGIDVGPAAHAYVGEAKGIFPPDAWKPPALDRTSRQRRDGVSSMVTTAGWSDGVSGVAAKPTLAVAVPDAQLGGVIVDGASVGGPSCGVGEMEFAQEDVGAAADAHRGEAELASPPQAEKPLAEPGVAVKQWLSIRVRYELEEEDALMVFVHSFRRMFGGKFDVDTDRRVVSITGQGRSDMPLKAARCLEYALHVCREEGYKPSDFSLVRIRGALAGERSAGEHEHLLVNGRIPYSAKYEAIAYFCGIMLEKVEREVLSVKAPIGDADTPPPEWPKFASAAAPARVEKACGKVLQLWGVTHSVDAALSRLVATMESAASMRSSEVMRPAQWRQVITLGASNTQILHEALVNFTGHDAAKVELDTQDGALSVVAKMKDIDVLYRSVVDILTPNLPDTIAWVDMVTPCTLRRFWASSASIEKQAGVRAGLVSLIPWWPMTRMLVVVPDGGRNPGVLRKVCDVLDARVRNWCSRRVSSYFCKNLLQRVSVADPSEKDKATNSKDVRYQFLFKISEATGVDLWLDGNRLKGLVTDAGLREAAQATLDEQVKKLAVETKGSPDPAPHAPKPKKKKPCSSSPSVQQQQQQQQQFRQPPQLHDRHQLQQHGRFQDQPGEPYTTGPYQYQHNLQIHPQGGMPDTNTQYQHVPQQYTQPYPQFQAGMVHLPLSSTPGGVLFQQQHQQQHYQPPGAAAAPTVVYPYVPVFSGAGDYLSGGVGGINHIAAASTAAYPAVPVSSGAADYLGGGSGGINHNTAMNGTPGHFVPSCACYIAGGGGGGGGGWGGGGCSGDGYGSAPEHLIQEYPAHIGGGVGSGWIGGGGGGGDGWGDGDGLDNSPGHFVPGRADYSGGGGCVVDGVWDGGGGGGGGGAGVGDVGWGGNDEVGNAPGDFVQERAGNFGVDVGGSEHAVNGGSDDGGGGGAGWTGSGGGR